MEELKKIEVFKRLGSSLIERGQWFLRKAFDVKVKRVLSSTQIRNFLIGVGFDNSKLYFADRSYSIIDLSVMRSIIKYSWVDRKKYLAEFHDCDDYAGEFKAHVSEIYNINSVALARQIEVDIGDKKVWHRAGLFLAIEDNILKVFLLETQNDKFVEIKKGVPLVIGTWTYKLNSLDF